jgi:hypothetical protein
MRIKRNNILTIPILSEGAILHQIIFCSTFAMAPN